MKLSSIILVAVFGAATQVLSAPALLFKKQFSVVSILQAETSAVVSAVSEDLRSINSAIQQSAKDANVQVQLVTDLNANFSDITNQLLRAGSKIINTTMSASTTLIQSDIDILNQLVVSQYALGYSIKNAITNALQPLRADTRVAVRTQANTAVATVQIFLGPLTRYSATVTLAV